MMIRAELSAGMVHNIMYTRHEVMWIEPAQRDKEISDL